MANALMLRADNGRRDCSALADLRFGRRDIVRRWRSWAWATGPSISLLAAR
jgi:hypothetical protein